MMLAIDILLWVVVILLGLAAAARGRQVFEDGLRGGTLGNELAQKGVDVVILEAGARHE